MGSYPLAYTLGEHAGAMTSDAARRAFGQTLLAEGFAVDSVDGRDVRQKLPDTTLVGEFENGSAAKAALMKAKGAAEAADPGKMFLTHAVITSYRRVMLVGPRAVPKQPAAQATTQTGTKAEGALAKLKLTR